MGVSTHGYVSDKVVGIDVFNIITSKFDKDAKFDIQMDKSYGSEIGRVYFKFNDEDRNLFYCLGEITPDRDMDFKNGKYAYLSLGCWGNSVQIMTEIVKCFGGYIDENDCDDKNEFYVPQAENFEYADYVKERDNIVNILDNHLNMSMKIQIATQILNHKNQLKELLK